jgi:tetratricopeptide (TPR) repeat protein
MKRVFAPLYFIAEMVWVARQDFHKAEELAAKGAELQSRGAQEEWMLPAFGLHWLRGLLQLRSGDVAAAVASFDREINEGCQTSIYYREYRVNALLGKGYAHLAAGDAEVAAHAFQSVLGSMPTNARALLGLQRVADRRGRVSEAESLLARVHDSLAELTKGGRLVEAALVRASIDAARGADEHASEILQRLLKNAPPGQAGWSIPIDPAFAPLREAPCFARVLTSLSSRAS